MNGGVKTKTVLGGKFMPKAKIVIDTCVLVVAGMSKNANYANAVIQIGVAGKLEMYASDYTIGEIKDVFGRAKFKGLLDTPRAKLLLQNYLEKVVTVDVNKLFLDKANGVCKDPKDVPFLALADQANCDFITTLDQKHLLSIVGYEGIKIFKPIELLKEVSNG